jgi:ATP adenylyltransferase
MQLITAPKPKRCIFCHLPRRKNQRDALVLATTRHCAVLLNRYPYNSGHLMVSSRRHVADLEELTRTEHDALAELLRCAVGIVRREFRAEGANVGLNLGAVAGAGIADHLHWHVVPRWGGDTNFMPTLADVKVIPEHLTVTYDRLRPHFDALLGVRRARRKKR